MRAVVGIVGYICEYVVIALDITDVDDNNGVCEEHSRLE
jgi:hypothetical protein